MDKLTTQEYQAIDDEYGSSGVAGAELLISMRAQRQRPADPFAQPSRPERTGPGPVFLAAFASECSGCLGDVEEGDRARMYEGEAWHADCVPGGAS